MASGDLRTRSTLVHISASGMYSAGTPWKKCDAPRSCQPRDCSVTIESPLHLGSVACTEHVFKASVPCCEVVAFTSYLQITVYCCIVWNQQLQSDGHAQVDVLEHATSGTATSLHSRARLQLVALIAMVETCQVRCGLAHCWPLERTCTTCATYCVQTYHSTVPQARKAQS